MNEKEKQALQLISDALQPGVRFTRAGYIQIEMAINILKEFIEKRGSDGERPEDRAER